MDRKTVANYLFVGFILLGTAAGMFLRKPAIGAVLGVGLGFIVKALYSRNQS